MRYVITINVDYDDATTAEPALHVRALTEEIQRAIGEGLLASPTIHDKWAISTYEFDVRFDGDDDEYPQGE